MRQDLTDTIVIANQVGDHEGHQKVEKMLEALDDAITMINESKCNWSTCNIVCTLRGQTVATAYQIGAYVNN
jgi:hypothetical protein